MIISDSVLKFQVFFRGIDFKCIAVIGQDIRKKIKYFEDNLNNCLSKRIKILFLSADI